MERVEVRPNDYIVKKILDGESQTEDTTHKRGFVMYSKFSSVFKDMGGRTNSTKRPAKMAGRVLRWQALVASAALAGCISPDPSSEPVAVTRTSQLEILAMGDSMMAWHRVSGRSIADEVRRQLGASVVDRSFTAARFNYLLPITGAMGLNISKQYQSGDWDWVIMNGGGNDLWFGCGCVACDTTIDRLISKDSASGKIPNLVSRIRSDGAQVIFLGYLHSPGRFSIVDNCKDEAIELERRMETLTSRQVGFHFVNLSKIVASGDSSFHSLDVIHPSLKASKLIGGMVAEIIRSEAF